MERAPQGKHPVSASSPAASALARLDALASPALSGWLRVNAARVTPIMRAAVDNARESHILLRMRTAPAIVPSPGPKLANERLTTYSVEQLRNMHRNVGVIFRADDGTRAVCIGWDKWLLDPVPPGQGVATGEKVDNKWVAERGAWRVEAYAPRYVPHSEVVYMDLDGTGRKVYTAVASKYGVVEYEKGIKAWEKAGKPSTGAPRRPSLFYVQHKGVQYTVAPTAWYGVTDALSWYIVGEPRPTRRAEAAKSADRRVLSAGAAAALDALVLHTLPDMEEGRSTYSLTVTDLWRDLTENRENVFAVLHDKEGFESYPWKVTFTPRGDDDKLLSDAVYSSRTGERLIAASLRRLVVGKWADEHYRETRKGDSVKGYVRGPRALSRKGGVAATGYQSPRGKAERAADEAEKRLRGHSSDYRWLSRPEYKALQDARAAVLAARALAEHPFAEHPFAETGALAQLAAAVVHLNEVAGSV